MGTTVYDLSACACCGDCGCPGIPDTLTATVTSACGAINGATATLTRSGDEWSGTLSACGIDVRFICVGSEQFNIALTPEGCFLTPSRAATGQCDPFQWSADFTYVNGGSCTCCATGGITITITE